MTLYNTNTIIVNCYYSTLHIIKLMTLKAIFCLVLILLPVSSSNTANTTVISTANSTQPANQTEGIGITDQVPSNNKPLSIKGPTTDIYNQNLDTKPQTTFPAFGPPVYKSQQNQASQKSLTTISPAIASEVKMERLPDEKEKQMSSSETMPKNAISEQPIYSTPTKSVSQQGKTNAVTAPSDLKNDEKLKTQAIQQKKERHSLSQSKQQNLNGTKIIKDQKSLHQKQAEDVQPKPLIPKTQIQKEQSIQIEIESTEKGYSNETSVLVTNLSNNESKAKDFPKQEVRYSLKQDLANKTVISFKQESSDNPEVKQKTQTSKQIKIIPLSDQSEEESQPEEIKYPIKGSSPSKQQALTTNSSKQSQKESFFEAKNKENNIQKDQTEKQKQKQEKSGSVIDQKKMQNTEKKQIYIPIKPQEEKVVQKEATIQIYSMQKQKEKASTKSDKKRQKQDVYAQEQVAQQPKIQLNKEELSKNKSVYQNHTQKDKKQTENASSNVPQSKNQDNQKQIQSIQTNLIQQKAELSIQYTTNKQTTKATPDLIKQQQKQPNLKDLLQEVKTDLSETVKTKVIKHFQEQIKLQQQRKQSNLQSAKITEQRPNQQYLKQENDQNEPQPKNSQHVMDTQTVTVIIVLTSLISIPIVREIRSKANQPNHLIGKEPNDTATTVEESNQRLGLQFSDLDNQTGFGLEETIEQQLR